MNGLGMDTFALVGIGVTAAFLLAGLWLLVMAWLDRSDLHRRTELEQVEAEAARLRSRLDAWLRRQQLGLALLEKTSRAGASLSALDLLTAYLAAAGLGFLIIWSLAPAYIAVLGIGLGYLAVNAWLERKRRGRLEEFVGQLPELARTLSNATSAGRSLQSALRLAGQELSDPAGTELRLVNEQLRIGAGVDAALATLAERLPSRELAVLTSTLIIQQRSGGDVVRALRDMADTLDARKDLRREIKTIVSSAIQTGYVTGAMGVGLILLVNQLQDGMIDQMARDPLGIMALVVAGGLYTLAVLLGRRMTNIDV